MYQKENSSWLKHADFVILDILCLQVAFILSYWMRMGRALPYKVQPYDSMALVLILIQIVVTFFGESFSGVLKRGPLKELLETVYHCSLVMLLAIVYLFLSKNASVYSRVAFIAMWAFYVMLAYCVRMMLKEAINARKYSEGEKRSVLADCDRTGEDIQGVPVVANVDSTIAFIHKNWVDEVLHLWMNFHSFGIF